MSVVLRAFEIVDWMLLIAVMNASVAEDVVIVSVVSPIDVATFDKLNAAVLVGTSDCKSVEKLIVGREKEDVEDESGGWRVEGVGKFVDEIPPSVVTNNNELLSWLLVLIWVGNTSCSANEVVVGILVALDELAIAKMIPVVSPDVVWLVALTVSNLMESWELVICIAFLVAVVARLSVEDVTRSRDIGVTTATKDDDTFSSCCVVDSERIKLDTVGITAEPPIAVGMFVVIRSVKNEVPSLIGEREGVTVDDVKESGAAQIIE